MILVFTVILVALIFTYTNGFHDTANSIATVVGTKVLTPRQAIFLATVTNLLGAMVGGAVAKTIASGLIDSALIPAQSSSQMLICALTAAIVWNLLTWYFGLPSSSSHALVGGLCGAAFAAAQNNYHAIIWMKAPAEGAHWWTGGGVLFKVVIPMIISPILGLLIAFVLMAALYFLLHSWRPRTVTSVFGKAQLVSSAYMGFSHGTNDAQKTMGIIALSLMAATSAGTFNEIPGWLRFLYTPEPGKAVYASMNQLGEIYRDGRGVTANAGEAEKWFRKAAAKNNPDAMENLAALIRAKQSPIPDEKEATSLVKKALEIRNGTAPDPLLLEVPKLKDAPADSTAALAWYRSLAEKGNPAAEAFLGISLLNGTVMEKNETLGVQWLEKAAAHKNAEARFGLGVLHLQGRAVQKDETAALHYFLKASDAESIGLWIKILCALTMAAGTALGGWRIIKTLGHKLVKLQAVHGFAAETAGASVLLGTAMMGMPVSTTHVITSAIMGVGAAKRLNALKWNVAERIIWAWILTLPVSAGLAYGLVRVARLLGASI